eukprot:Lithocolla_globosa_v1_NODE_570_length_3712_cov_22.282199.p4 type:complete len:166 gc:universal NODE_570_length_3712_cov_22.282199:2857-3354(+)
MLMDRIIVYFVNLTWCWWIMHVCLSVQLGTRLLKAYVWPALLSVISVHRMLTVQAAATGICFLKPNVLHNAHLAIYCREKSVFQSVRITCISTHRAMDVLLIVHVVMGTEIRNVSSVLSTAMNVSMHKHAPNVICVIIYSTILVWNSAQIQRIPLLSGITVMSLV